MRKIFVTFQKEGIHHFPNALLKDNYKDVEFLGYLHRHLFHFKVWIEVFDDDREIEFIQFKRFCESLFSDNILQLDNMSCEMISDSLYMEISKKYPNRAIDIEVSEDNENGSFITYGK